jgi:hypothetical protein
MSVRTYDPKNVIITINAIPMSGFSDGTFLEVDRDEPTWTKVVGADGLVTRGKTNNFSGTLTLTLKQSSPSNDVLSGLLAIDEATNNGVVPVLIKDLSGNSIYFSARAWINQYANSTFGKDISDRVWALSLDELDLFVGSNAES